MFPGSIASSADVRLENRAHVAHRFEGSFAKNAKLAFVSSRWRDRSHRDSFVAKGIVRKIALQLRLPHVFLRMPTRSHRSDNRKAESLHLRTIADASVGIL